MELEADWLFQKCQQLGKINDLIIVCRFPFSYGIIDVNILSIGRIECCGREVAQELYYKLNAPQILTWSIS